MKQQVLRIIQIFLLLFVAQVTVAATLVDVARVKSLDNALSTTITGTLMGSQGVMLKPEIVGRIKRIAIKSGMKVKKGDVLIELNPDIVKAQLLEDKANVELSKLNYNRYQKLIKTNVISHADYDSAFANYQVAKAKLAATQAHLEQHTILAPFSGKLGLLVVSEGDYVADGDPLIYLEAIDPIYVNFNIPERDINKLKINQQIKIKSDLLNEDTQATIFAFDSVIDQDTRTLMVRATIDNSQELLLPGAFVKVEISLNKDKNLLEIPATSLLTTEDGTFVYLLDDKSVIHLTKVRVLKRTDKTVIINQGLKAGEQIVATGVFKLQDKMTVEESQKD